jgi:alkylation response protein AidB-like acyl-CoA dehydrogenase
LVRYAPECEAFLVLDGDRALLATPDGVEIEPVESALGAPYGRVSVRRGEDLGEGSGDRLRRGWQVAIGAEAAGVMQAAIGRTATHVTERHQFGKPIGSFQAVQHRLARAYVMAQGTKWLSRRAAWYNADEFLTASAAAYACEAAHTTYTNTHQVTGAIGITTEYGLVLWTTRLVSLQRELGGQRAHALRVAAARRAAGPPAMTYPVNP